MLSRKEFLATLAASGWTAFLAGCGGGGGGYDAGPPAPPPPVAPPPPGALGSCQAVQITGNHGHVLNVPVADLTSTVAVTYAIRGSADHSHDVTLSPAQLAALRAGGTVTVASTSTAGHSHDISEACT